MNRDLGMGYAKRAFPCFHDFSHGPSHGPSFSNIYIFATTRMRTCVGYRSMRRSKNGVENSSRTLGRWGSQLFLFNILRRFCEKHCAWEREAG